MPARSHGRRIGRRTMRKKRRTGGKARCRWPRLPCGCRSSLLLLADWPPHLVLRIWLHNTALRAGQFVRQGIGVIDLMQRFDNRSRVYFDGSCDGVAVQEVPRQRLDVSVEDDPHHLGIFVDDRTTGVPANYVGCGDGIERSVEIDRRFWTSASCREAGTEACCHGRRHGCKPRPWW